MTYPKPIMSITELMALGFSRDFLNQCAHRKGQTYASKTLGGGKWLFDTAEFEKQRVKFK